MSALTSSTQHCPRGPKQSNNTKESERHTDWKGTHKTLFICWPYGHLCKKKNKQKNPQRIHNKDRSSESRTGSGYKINTQKSTLFLYAGNEQSELKLKNNVTKEKIENEMLRDNFKKNIHIIVYLYKGLLLKK